MLCISGNAPIIDEMATVTVIGLDCTGTYTITAEGIRNGELVGPRFLANINLTDICEETTVTDDDGDEG